MGIAPARCSFQKTNDSEVQSMSGLMSFNHFSPKTMGFEGWSFVSWKVTVC